MHDNNALFSSAHGALTFAFNFAGQCYDRPMMNRMASPAFGTGKGLVGLDGSAQSGMIRAEIKALGPVAEAILIARVAPRTLPCGCRSACCSGQKPNREWTDAIALLADHVRTTALLGCMANGLMRRDYMVRYFTKKDDRITIEALAEKHDINRDTASNHNARVFLFFSGSIAKKGKPAIPGMEQIAFDAADSRLREIGMVGECCAA